MDDIIMVIFFVPMALFFLGLFISSLRDSLDRKNSQKLKEKKKELEIAQQEYKQKRDELTPDLVKEQCDSLIQEYKIKLDSVTKAEKIAKEKANAAAEEEKHHKNCRANLLERYNTKIAQINAEIDQKANEKVDKILKDKQARLNDLMADVNKKRVYLNQQLTPNINFVLPSSKINKLIALQQNVLSNRFFYALESNPAIQDLNFEAKIKSSSTEEIYHTTLDHCTCKDFQFNRKGEPCKHILYLAYIIGLLQINQKLQEASIQKLNSTYKITNELDAKIKMQKKKIELQNESIQMLQNTKADLESLIEELKNEIKIIINEKTDAYPRLAGIMADLLTLHYEKSASILETKKNPALIEAARIRELKSETRDILKDKKILEYKIAYIEALFPNIVDIFDLDFETSEDFNLETDETTDRTRNFLSHEEFSKLSTIERNQLALERYIQGEKTKWQVGRDYEMYIGQQFENHGFEVKYTGIVKNLEDMGRDLICKKKDVTYIVQCKNWSQEKEIHEKHIFQLLGTVVLRQIETPNENVVGVFVTTTDLSPKAKEIANHLNIEVYSNIPLQEFSRIKCNINRTTGEKIYHLPFDQKYDSTQIEKKNGEFFASTVEEAENAGFRRAWKHFGE